MYRQDATLIHRVGMRGDPIGCAGADLDRVEEAARVGRNALAAPPLPPSAAAFLPGLLLPLRVVLPLLPPGLGCTVPGLSFTGRGFAAGAYEPTG